MSTALWPRARRPSTVRRTCCCPPRQVRAVSMWTANMRSHSLADFSSTAPDDRSGVIQSCSAAVAASTELPEFRKLQADVAGIHRRYDQARDAVAEPSAEQVISDERRRRMHHKVGPASSPALGEHLFRRQRRVAIHRLEVVGEVAVRVMLQLLL